MKKIALIAGALGSLFCGSLLASPLEDQELSWYVKRGLSVVDCKEEGLFGSSWGVGVRQGQQGHVVPLLVELDVIHQSDRLVNNRACFLKIAGFKHLPDLLNNIYVGAGVSLGAHEKDAAIPLTESDAKTIHDFYHNGPKEMADSRIKLLSVNSARWKKTTQAGLFGEALIGFEWNVSINKVIPVWNNAAPQSTPVPMRMFIEASVHQPGFILQKHVSYRPHVQVDLGLGF